MRRRFMGKNAPKLQQLTINTISGASVSVNGVTKTVDSFGRASFDLEAGRYLYSVTAPGYMIRTDFADVYGHVAFSQTDLYLIPSHYADIYIYNADGTYGSNPGSNPIGIYVECQSSRFILSLTCFGKGQGDGSSKSVESLPDTLMSKVLSDYNGKENFQKMVANSDYPNSSYYVLGKINTFSAGNIGAGQWYLPSGGQMGIIQQYYSEIKSACNKCGSYPSIAHIIYTSTRCTASYDPQERSSGSVFAPDIFRGGPINERNIRFNKWSDVFYWAVADKP